VSESIVMEEYRRAFERVGVLEAEVERLTREVAQGATLYDDVYRGMLTACGERDAMLTENGDLMLSLDIARAEAESAKGAARDHFAAYEMASKECAEARAERDAAFRRVGEAEALLRKAHPDYDNGSRDAERCEMCAFLSGSTP
jgi:hypothetical protein